jgi:hypothetical protein
MDISLSEKVSAFCLQLGDNALRDLAHEQGMAAEFERAAAAIQAGRPDARLNAHLDNQLETDLDALDAMMVRAVDQRLYPMAVRNFDHLPGADAGTGAQWWTCPQGRCTGRGRVRPGQQPSICGGSGKPVVAQPLPR